VPTGGGTSSVNATAWNAGQGYETVAAPFPRMVIDLSNFDGSRWINLPGTSGHVFHRHYWDQTRLWRQGDTIPFLYTPEAVHAATEDLLTLQP
jgi:penicillin amidase